ncbi:hypothetical protein [Chitinophaga sp.]|uniref:hypothetical protein n=1 Tax=Chitinophaga sp. TaxID=1869181 RepID=UPI002F957CFF
MHIPTAASLLLFGCIACHESANKTPGIQVDTTAAFLQNTSSEAVSEAPPSTRIILYDLDQDHQLDTIRLNTTGKNGNFYCADEVSFSMTRGGKKTFTDGCWGTVDSAFLRLNKSAVAANDVFIYTKNKQTWVLIFGAWSGSGREPMAVIRVKDQAPEMILHDEIDHPQHIGDDNTQHTVFLIGKGISERDGGDDSLHTTIYSYDPYYLYNLEKDGKIDSAATAQYNRAHYVWAGWQPDENLRVVFYNDGRRQLLRK